MKRTKKQILEDYDRIKEAAEIATNVEEIAVLTELSKIMINNTLSKYPKDKEKIKNQLKENRKREKENQKVEKVDNKKQEDKRECNKEMIEGYVIDASISGVTTIRDDLEKICKTNSKIILTSVTIYELEKMQSFFDIVGNKARYILGIAAEREKTFKPVLIKENHEKADDNIIEYCAENKEHITLLTSDKTMTLKARMYGVKVHYMKHQIQKNKEEKMEIKVEKKGKKLYLVKSKNTNNVVKIISNGVEVMEEMPELKIGDEIIMAVQKTNHVSITHNKIVSLDADNRFELIFSKEIYTRRDERDLEKVYKECIREMKVKVLK